MCWEKPRSLFCHKNCGRVSHSQTQFLRVVTCTNSTLHSTQHAVTVVHHTNRPMSTSQPSVNTELEPDPQTHIRRGHSDTQLRQTDSTYHTIIIYTDGSYHNQQDLAGIGFVLKTKGGQEIYRGSEQSNANTSMETEAQAMQHALKIAAKFNPKHIAMHTDCEPLQRKLTQKTPPEKPLYKTVRTQISEFKDTTVNDIPRNQNKQADDLASLALRRAKDEAAAS